MAWHLPGPTRADIWTFNKRDGTLSPVWDNTALTPVVNLDNKLKKPLEVVGDFDAFAQKYPNWSVVVSNLIDGFDV